MASVGVGRTSDGVKVVINKCFGGFGLSLDALLELVKSKSECVEVHDEKEYFGSDREEDAILRRREPFKEGFTTDVMGMYLFKAGKVYMLKDRSEKELRCHPDLVGVVERLGQAANGSYAALEIIEIPFEGTDGWYIDEYDGQERINGDHPSWG